jgi:hypothetical protein
MKGEFYKNSLDKVICDLSVEDMKVRSRLIHLNEKLISYIKQEEKEILNHLA